jgi:hypothetical protein
MRQPNSKKRTFHWGRIGLVIPLVTMVGGAPILVAIPAMAQSTTNSIFRGSPVTINNGANLPATYTAANRIVLAKNETMALTITVNANIRDRQGRLLIPYGAKIAGQLQPVSGGTQFIAKTLQINDETPIPLAAQSAVITRTETIKKGPGTEQILNGALIGAGAMAVISLITGDHRVSLGELLGGAAIGAAGGAIFGQRSDQVLVVEPGDLNLTLTQPLTLYPR